MKMKRRKIFVLLLALVVVLGTPVSGSASSIDHPDLEIVSVNDIPGVIIGHYTDATNATGVTAIISTVPGGATGGVSVLGGSPATRETDLIDPTRTVQIINAISLSGGSAFGLDAAGGIMQYLEKRELGVPVGVTVVPIVTAASIFDLHRGESAHLGYNMVRPGVPEGYAAAAAAFRGDEWRDGNVGGGTGAGVAATMKGGLGSFAYRFGDLYVGVVVVANPAGQVIDPVTRNIIAGRIDTETNTFIDAEQRIVNINEPPIADRTNTTIAAVITNAQLTQSEANRLAEMAHDGFSRAIQPTHTPADGDVVFVMATGTTVVEGVTWGQEQANMSLLGVLAVNAMERAIVSAVYNAESAYGLLGAATLRAEGTTPSQPESRFVPILNDVVNSPSLRFAEDGTVIAVPRAVSVNINEVAVAFTSASGRPFVDANNRTLVPFRQTMEAFGAEVEWDGSERVATAVFNEIVVEVPVGQAYILKDGEQISNDTIAVLQNDRVFLPIRVVLEAFGFTVDWDPYTNSVVALYGE
jgi:L-aminopeptidase/D-esterase-like protein